MTPWHMGADNDGCWGIWTRKCEKPGSLNHFAIAVGIQDEREAAFIATACNEHAALVAVAEAARNLTSDNGGRALDAALARLAEVQGGAK